MTSAAVHDRRPVWLACFGDVMRLQTSSTVIQFSSYKKINKENVKECVYKSTFKLVQVAIGIKVDF